MVHMCKSTISSGVFLCIFQIVISGVNSGVKGQKMTQNGKKLCKLWFYGLLGGGGGKRDQNGPKLHKNCLSHSVSQEPYLR